MEHFIKVNKVHLTGYREEAEAVDDPDPLRASSEITWLLKAAHEQRLQTGQPWVTTGHLLLCLVQYGNMSQFPPFWMALRPVQHFSIEDLKNLNEDDAD